MLILICRTIAFPKADVQNLHLGIALMSAFGRKQTLIAGSQHNHNEILLTLNPDITGQSRTCPALSGLPGRTDTDTTLWGVLSVRVSGGGR